MKLLIKGKTINTITNSNKKKERKEKGANMTHNSRKNPMYIQIMMKQHEHK
jgi:hypothetical protein